MGVPEAKGDQIKMSELERVRNNVKNDLSCLSIVVPVFNEQDTLPLLLPKLLSYQKQRGSQIIIVNDGSTDLTRDVLSKLDGIKVIHHKVNRGYGGALKTGIESCTTELVVTIDADGQHSLEDIDKIMVRYLETDADLIIGKRMNYKLYPLRDIGKWMIWRFARMLQPLNISDLNSGFKLYKTNLAQAYLKLCPDNMSFSDIITLLFLNQKHLVIEHPISVQPRVKGESKVTNLTFFETLLAIVSMAMLVNPLRIFIPLSIFFLTLGFIWAIPFVLLGRGFSVGSIFVLTTGIFSFFLGLIAEQLSHIRKETLIKDQVNKSTISQE